MHELVADGQTATAQIGSSARIRFRPEYDPTALGTVQDPSSPEPTAQAVDSALGQTASVPEQIDEERILFFPSRREIVVDNPRGETRTILSQTTHLIDSSGNGYLYKIDEADVWNAPYDEFADLKADLRSIVGGDDWSPGFEDRIRDDFERAHQFRLRTHADGFTVLEGGDRETFENVAKRKLEHNDHYTQYVGDTGMRLKAGPEAEVKEALYEEGYPVIDERRLDEGATLDVQLTDDISLRDYQHEWVDAFEARGSGVFVGPSGSGKTIAAIGSMESVAGETLSLVPNREMANQWESELLATTTLRQRQIGQYHGGKKRIRPVTIANGRTRLCATASCRHSSSRVSAMKGSTFSMRKSRFWRRQWGVRARRPASAAGGQCARKANPRYISC